MDVDTTLRTMIKVSDTHGWAAGTVGLYLGYNAQYDSVKVGFVDADGEYTGEYTRVPRSAAAVVDTAEGSTGLGVDKPSACPVVFVMSAGNTTKEPNMTANLSTAATKTLRTIAATDAGHIDTYSGTAGIDCRSLAALVRKGFLVRVAGGYARHAITPAGRAAIGETAPVAAPVARPATVILIGSKAQYAADYTQAGADSVDAAMKAARARAAAMRSTRRGR